VEAPAAEVEGHGGGGDRDAAVLFQLQEVGPRAPRLALGADLAGHLDRAAEQQELLGQRGLAGVGMRNDRKGPAAGDLRREGGGVVQHGAPSSGIAAARPRGSGGAETPEARVFGETPVSIPETIPETT